MNGKVNYLVSQWAFSMWQILRTYSIVKHLALSMIKWTIYSLSRHAITVWINNITLRVSVLDILLWLLLLNYSLLIKHCQSYNDPQTYIIIYVIQKSTIGV